MASRLFDPAFLRSLEALRIVARRVPAGGRMAEQRSRARGGGVEFADVRPYVPGDDFRAIDWNLFRRLDRVFLRVFLEDEDLPVYVLLDRSASMAVPPTGGGDDKSTVARRTVAALAYVAMHHLDRVAVLPFADRPLAPIGGLSGGAAFQRLLAWLERGDDRGETGLVTMLRSLAHRGLRRGLCVVVSDFLDPAGAGAIAGALKVLPHTLLLVRIEHSDAARPRLRGELELVDSESGERLAVHVDGALLDRYEQAYRAFEGELAAAANARRGTTLTVTTDAPVVPQLAAAFRDGVLAV